MDSDSECNMTNRNTWATIRKNLPDKGQTHAVKADASSTVIGGNLSNGFATPEHIIFAAHSI